MIPKKKIGYDRHEGLQQRGRQGGVPLQLSLRYLEGDVQDHGWSYSDFSPVCDTLTVYNIPTR